MNKMCDVFESENSAEKVIVKDDKIESYNYYGGYSFFLDNINNCLDRIKEYYKVMQLIFYYYNSKDVKNKVYGMQNQYIIEFTFYRGLEYNEVAKIYRVSHIYKFPMTIESKIKVLGIEKIASDQLEKLKDRCTVII